jgi:hypothetical protein
MWYRKTLNNMLGILCRSGRDQNKTTDRIITGFVTRLTRRVSLVEQELLTLPERLSSPPVFSEVHVTWSLGLYVCFVNRYLSFCIFKLLIKVIRVITKLPNSYKGKIKTHKYINRHNQSTTGKLWKP